jgi:hypothetical protein
MTAAAEWFSAERGSAPMPTPRLTPMKRINAVHCDKNDGSPSGADSGVLSGSGYAGCGERWFRDIGSLLKARCRTLRKITQTIVPEATGTESCQKSGYKEALKQVDHGSKAASNRFCNTL